MLCIVLHSLLLVGISPASISCGAGIPTISQPHSSVAVPVVIAGLLAGDPNLYRALQIIRKIIKSSLWSMGSQHGRKGVLPADAGLLSTGAAMSGRQDRAGPSGWEHMSPQ